MSDDELSHNLKLLEDARYVCRTILNFKDFAKSVLYTNDTDYIKLRKGLVQRLDKLIRNFLQMFPNSPPKNILKYKDKKGYKKLLEDYKSIRELLLGIKEYSGSLSYAINNPYMNEIQKMIKSIESNDSEIKRILKDDKTGALEPYITDFNFGSM